MFYLLYVKQTSWNLIKSNNTLIGTEALKLIGTYLGSCYIFGILLKSTLYSLYFI